jgi:hypothetical protein
VPLPPSTTWEFGRVGGFGQFQTFDRPACVPPSPQPEFTPVLFKSTTTLIKHIAFFAYHGTSTLHFINLEIGTESGAHWPGRWCVTFDPEVEGCWRPIVASKHMNQAFHAVRSWDINLVKSLPWSTP